MSEVFDKDYFENGLITSKSCYENYRWIPELTYPLAHSLINFLHLKPDFKILEYGCAHGFLVKALNDLFIPTFGVDISTYAINSCPNDVSNKLLKIKRDFIHSDIKNHFGINNFNYCISKDVFEHIEPNKLKYIVEELSFLCKKLFVIVPLGDNGIYRINTYHLDPTHVIAENEEWWINFFKKNGGYQLKSFDYNVIGIKDRWKKINAKGNGFFFIGKNMNNEYEIKFDQDKLGYFIRVRALAGGKHYAVHRTYEDCTGVESITKSITLDVKDMLLKNIELYGITEGFIIKKINSNYKNTEIKIRHKLTNDEVNFTSTGEKLHFHQPIFQKLKDTNYSSIIRATMTLHQVCASKCHFCSTINRNRKDSISLDEAKAFINKLYFDQEELNKTKFSKYNSLYKNITNSNIKLRGLILSGGGQPNLWPHFEEFVDWLSELDIDLGLITNGFPEKINSNIYKKFKWIRLSITPEDASPFYPNKKFDLQRIPDEIINNNQVKFGLSYVYGTWTSNDIINRLVNVVDKWNVDYIRFLTDCNLGREQQLLSHKRLAEKLYSSNLIDEYGNPKNKIFHQLKYHGNQIEANALWDEGKCYLQTYNVFWDTTGHEDNGYSYCYPCDSVTVLASDENQISSERGFNYKKWGTVKANEVEKLYKEEWKSYFDPRENCTACLFMKNNQTVKDLINDKVKINLQNKIEHINFP